jgi:hypothetical protein
MRLKAGFDKLNRRYAPHGGFDRLNRRYRAQATAAARASTNASTQRLTCSGVCAAESCTRMRALPTGTTG